MLKNLLLFPTFGQKSRFFALATKVLHNLITYLSFFISLHSPTFLSPMGQYFPCIQWTLMLDSPLHVSLPAPYMACQAIFWFSGQAHLDHLSIITQHAVLHLLLIFSVSPMDHELLVYKSYIWLTSIFPELSKHRASHKQWICKDCHLFFMA